MSEQYAFAIGFDREPEETDDRPDDNWMRVLEQVSAAIVQANLSPIDSARWDEFGQGYVFWGTESDCTAVRQALSPFDLYIEEDRNLDQGYYATADHLYYVDLEGQIYKISDQSAHSNEPFEKICSIPLDAYRSRKVDPDLDAHVQAQIQAQTKIQAQSHQAKGIAQTSDFPAESISAESIEAPLIETSAAEMSLSNASDPQVATSSESKVAGLERAENGVAENSTLEAPLVDENPANSQAIEAATAGSDTAPSKTEVVSKTVTLATYVQQLRQLKQKTSQISELELRLRTALVQVEALKGQLASQPQTLSQNPSTQPAPQIQALEELRAQLYDSSEQNRLLQEQSERQTARMTELEQALSAAQAHIEEKSAQIAELEQAIASAQEQLQIIQAQDEQKYGQIGELEQAVAALRQASVPTVTAEDHERVQQKSAAQEAQVLELYRQIQRLELRLQDVSSQSDQKVGLSKYQALEEDARDKASMIAELRHTLQQQERDLREWQTVAEAKVDWAEHHQLQEELRRLQSRKKRGLFSRLFGWLWN